MESVRRQDEIVLLSILGEILFGVVDDLVGSQGARLALNFWCYTRL